MSLKTKEKHRSKKAINEDNKLIGLNKVLRTISKINHILLTVSDEKILCQKICNSLVKIKGHELTFISLLEKDKSAILPFVVAGKEKEFVKTIKKYWDKYTFNGCPSGKAIKSGVPYVVDNLKIEERFIPWEDEAIERGFLSSIILPLFTKEKAIGVLHLYSYIEDGFSKEEIKFLKEVAGDISIGIRGIRSERSLVESEERFKRLSEAGKEGIIFHDNGVILDSNQVAADLFGLKLSSLIGKKVYDFMPPESRKLAIANVKKKFEGTYEVQFDRSGEIIDIEVIAKQAFLDSKEIRVAVFRNITDRKTAEREIISLARFPDENPNPVIRAGLDGKVLYHNPACSEVLGKFKIKVGKYAPKLFLDYIKVLTGKKSTVPTIVEVHTNGNIFEFTFIFFRGKDYINIYGRDITNQYIYEQELRDSYNKMNNTLDNIIKALASVVETKDPYTYGHQEKVAKLSVEISKLLNMNKERIDIIRKAAIVHDIGKITIPSSILTKPSILSDLEFSLIKTHCKTGQEILKGIDFGYPIAEIIYQHHERENGSGYPKGLKSPDILFEAKIIAVADVVEAMSSHRPYRPALGIKMALKELKLNKGILYDPAVVDACIELFTKKKFKF